MTAEPAVPIPPVRERILDAAEDCLRTNGIRRTTMSQVAQRAGVSRAYLYRFFPDKPTLVSAALIRRDETFWDDASERVRSQGTISGMVAEAVLLSRRSPLGPLAMQLAEAEPQDFAGVMGTFVHEVVPGLQGFWVDRLREAAERGVVRSDLDAELAAEWVIRVVVSLVEVPGARIDADDRGSLMAFLDEFLTPALSPR